MGSSRFLVWGLASGLLSSAVVTYWPASWEYAPGAIFGLTLALAFSRRAFGTFGWGMLKEPSILRIFGFVAASTAAYWAALSPAQWVLGTNGFGTFASYGSGNALAAIYVACFVGTCIWAFLLSASIRMFLFSFDIIRGMFLFAITAGMVGSVIVVGFDTFGFIPQFIFPVWYFSMALVVMYLYRSAMSPEEAPAPAAVVR